MHWDENLIESRPLDQRSTLAGAIMQGPEALLFGAAVYLNIISFAIINFAYNAETISRTFVTPSTSSRTEKPEFEVVGLGLNSAAG